MQYLYRAPNSIKTFWWRQLKVTGIRPNFGDELTPGLVDALFSKKCSWRRPKNSDMTGAGSTLEMVQLMNAPDTLKIWGSGFMLKDGLDGRIFDFPSFDFYAVRGYLSLERVKSDREVAVGDPGLLASRVYPRSTSVAGRVGLVYHWMHKTDPVVLALARDKKITLIDPSRKPAKVIADITSCDFVMSTSLHGLIVADSYGIPNAWIELDREIGGAGYKFEDYYSVFDGKAVQHSSDLTRDDDEIARLRTEYRPIPNLTEIQDNLIAAFPYREGIM
ncbi:polysaccharide pyruvyl transferase family protein [Rhodococcus sp. BP-252]|uniref:polysaccharide pyruvyl transferase family protein n=1 Tax=unclassified Rhodococcus (in: high G+C Gram-positive bacteria) TaxID=192944 RepID=UPI001C9A792A|nr:MULTISPECIES: polysaccharide pyruvyl transferase family protein [unclassified Rhodococcus (in: high G+C Gram-positive bacteria)]MBY6414500.1 polysaccharide pyruvyl transferase family protein [Rhodococcus sp. BP-320]MBY6419190.1 polysaccharide pyruvyl transferase family protein [Rhodococcus sp. BP-321]MBY6423967.1 polysaccharide pyruvyl transferase family protein [Rhodococcus sp. BP-324]MBY6429349.1 polysaccharide pyruvyl transferase family protein [Rhodococcus sp. BP-323]MBY6434310.1 polysa